MATKKSSKSSKKSASPDAIALLKADHVKVKGLLGDLEKSAMRGGAKAAKLVTQIATELKVHTSIEEEKDMFPKARKVMSRSELQDLGDRMKQRKTQLLRSM